MCLYRNAFLAYSFRSRKRLQKYTLFPNWQNNDCLRLRKNQTEVFVIEVVFVLLFHVEQQAFEVLALGVMDADRVVHGVGQLAHDAHTTAGIHGGSEDHRLEVFLADSLAAAEGHQQTTCRQRLHGALVDGTVSF